MKSSHISKDLFDHERIEYLNIVYNDEKYRGSIEDFFDNRIYNHIYVISYVSSYSYTLSLITKFEKAVLILGEEDTASKFYSLNIDEEERFLRVFIGNEDYCKKLKEGSLEVRYILGNKKVHSKIYLLEGKEKSLILIGSANLTKTAMSDSNQFEEIVIYDNHYNPKIVEIFCKRVNYLYNISSRDITNQLLKKLNGLEDKYLSILHSKVDIENIQSSIILNKESTLNIQNLHGSTIIAEKSSVININTLQSNIGYSEDEKVERIIEMIKNNAKDKRIALDDIFAKIEEDKSESHQRIVELEQIEKILENTTKKTKEGIVFRPVKELESKKEKLLKEIIKTKSVKKDEIINQRNVFIYDTRNDILFREDYEGIAIPYGQLINRESLRNALERLDNFVKSYELFLQGGINNEIMERVYEAILFTFTSPFVWLFRANISKEKSSEKIAEIPLVMILGGEANTGKTRLLNTLNQLIGNKFSPFSYGDLYTKSQTWMNVVFESNNVFPVLVDEIESTFFRGIGERQIKYFTNTLTKPCPCIIGTSNISFSVESQVVRRIYYLHFDCAFSEEKQIKAEADKYFEDKVGFLDDTVFKHFVYLFLKNVREGEELYKEYDPLYLSRKLFREMYTYAGLKIPENLPLKPYGDYYKRGSIEWQGFYLAHQDKFKEMRDGDNTYYVIDMTGIDHKIITEMKSRIPPSILKSGGVPLIVHKEPFLRFIGVKGKKTVLKKLFPFLFK